MDMAETVAKRSTCQRLAVGAIFALDSRPLSIGYNGVPSGLPHCNHTLAETEPCTAAVHAEANGIAWAARKGIPLKGAELFVTHMPCLKCAHLIINAGISRVVWKHDYRLTDGVDLLREAGVDLDDVSEELDEELYSTEAYKWVSRRFPSRWTTPVFHYVLANPGATQGQVVKALEILREEELSFTRYKDQVGKKVQNFYGQNKWHEDENGTKQVFVREGTPFRYSVHPELPLFQ